MQVHPHANVHPDAWTAYLRCLRRDLVKRVADDEKRGFVAPRHRVGHAQHEAPVHQHARVRSHARNDRVLETETETETGTRPQSETHEAELHTRIGWRQKEE